MQALYNLVNVLRGSDAEQVHLFGLPQGGPITCWARWAAKAVIFVDDITQRIVMFQQAPGAIISSSSQLVSVSRSDRPHVTLPDVRSAADLERNLVVT
eukprot:4642223-Amphidinium_carterae.1